MTTGAVAYTPPSSEDQPFLAHYNPPPEFKALVEQELHDAHHRACMIVVREVHESPPKRTDGRPFNYKRPAERVNTDRVKRRCTGCECPVDEYTASCETCRKRHQARRSYSPKPIWRKCKGCGCPVNDFTAGCPTCCRRHRRRRDSATRGKV